MTQTSTYYGTAAFRGSAIPQQPVRPSDSNGLMNEPLAWGHYAELDSPVEIEHSLHNEFQSYAEYQAEDNEEKFDFFHNAESWQFENIGKLAFLLIVLKAFTYPIPVFLCTIEAAIFLDRTPPSLTTYLILIPGVFLSLTCLFFHSTKSIISNTLNLASVLILYIISTYTSGETEPYLIAAAITFIMSLIGYDALLWLYSQFYVHDGSKFCRRDGMVTIGRRFKKPFTAPFYEFDPVMQLQVTPHGGHDYVLWLHHRYSNTKFCLANKLHTLGLDKKNLYAFWDTLQRYMDIEQPLPDLPVLEQTRHLDPVTAEYDRLHNRPERYWRDTSYAKWQDSEDAKALRDKVEHYPWQRQPCTLEPHLDPELDVETYYRNQQAKGIFSTPKPEDYDDIHRPTLKIFQDKKSDDVA